ncbi:MAG TPA: hypothetical protein VFI25_15145 [Planctomycetota bacterium]|jgi:hypothetical protein|nr:hypothetical protein [Planctomycetota bacterium]
MRIAAGIFLAGLLVTAARAGVTSVRKTIGEPGGASCCGPGSPPTLCDGVTPASANVQVTYDDAAHTLTLLVENTSPVTGGVPNPLLTSLHFNVPAGAVTGLSLLSQTGSAGAACDWSLQFDPDPTSGGSPAKLACLGAFSARLFHGGVSNAIANAAADTLAARAGSWVVGPVTFVLDVTTAPGAVLDATDFANAFSHNPPGDFQVNLGAYFKKGGPQLKKGRISCASACEPSAYVYGAPSLGGTVTFVLGGTPGCCGCLGLANDAGPTVFANVPGSAPLAVPLAFPALVLIGTTPLSDAAAATREISIPTDPTLVGATFHFAGVLADPVTGELSSSTGSSFTIVP